MNSQIYLDDPDLGEIEKQFLCKTIDSGYVSTFGPFVSEFEKQFSELINIDNVASIQSGTAGLYMALYELGIKPGDEIIIPVLTFVACANVVKYLGAVPVFVDIDSKTWTISIPEIKKHITQKTKAIMPVHLYGNPCDMNKINKLARDKKLFVIEDATESLLSMYNNQYAGTLGDFGVFSFNGNKLITTGGGGIVVCKDEKKISHIKFLINQARDEQKGYYHPEVGFNLRMTNLVASLGLAQLQRINTFQKQKKCFREIYADAFNEIDEISLQESLPGSEPTWWLNAISINRKGFNVDHFQDELKLSGIPTRRLFMPIVEFPPYYEKGNEKYKVAYEKYNNSIILPGSTLNTKESINYAVSIIKKLLGKRL